MFKKHYQLKLDEIQHYRLSKSLLYNINEDNQNEEKKNKRQIIFAFEMLVNEARRLIVYQKCQCYREL